MADPAYDCIVLGGGPGGYVAALRARQLGLSVALVEREKLGGICLNWGCIPTKALLECAEVYHRVQHAESYGIEIGAPRADLAKMVERSRRIARRLEAGVKHLLKKNGVPVFEGHGRYHGSGCVRVEGAGGSEELRGRHLLLATGARPRALPGLAFDGERIWSYRDALSAREIPQRLLVVGSGAIGVEFASFFRDLGSEVTLVELLPRILPAEDEEVAATLQRSFEQRGIRVLCQTRLAAAEAQGDGVAVRLETEGVGAEAQRFDRVLLAVGIRGNVEDLGLEQSGAQIEAGHVRVAAGCATDEPGLYAIGDVAGPPWLAHKASHEGVLCVEGIARGAPLAPLDPAVIPACTYARPQIASVGWNEARARASGRSLRIGRFPLAANGRAQAGGETEGFVKTIFDAESGALLGAHLIGAGVSELIQGFVIARALETTESELIHSVFPHPTVSEAMHEAVLDAFGRVLHR